MSNYNPTNVLIHGGWVGDFFFIWGEQKQHKKYKDYLNFQYPFLYSPFELKLTLFQNDPSTFYGTFVQTKKASLKAPVQDRVFYSEVGETLVYQANATSTDFIFPLEGIVIHKKDLPRYVENMKSWEKLPKITLASDFVYWLNVFSLLQTEILNGNLILSQTGSWELAKWNWEDWETTIPPVSFSLMESGVHFPNNHQENPSFKQLANDLCSHFIQYFIAKDNEVQHAFEQLHASKHYLLDESRKQPADNKTFLEELGAIPAVPFQTTIAIEEPTQDDEENWQIMIFLQDRKDPSIIVSLEDLHGGQHPWRVNPITRLKEDIYEIVQLAPELSSLSITHPTALVSKDVVYNLLTNQYDQLRSIGIGVVVPNWLKKRPYHFQTNIFVADKPTDISSDNESLFNWENISDFNFEIVLNGEKLTHEQFTELVNLKTPFIKWNGKWLYWDPKEAKHLKTYLNKQKNSETSLLETWKAYLLDDAEENEGISVSIQWDEKLANAIDNTLNKQVTTMPPPPSLRGELRPYQLDGMSWLFHMRRVGFGACLADDMGLGKSIQTIAYMLAVIENQSGNHSSTPFLIICPTSLIGNWEEELQRFAPHLSIFVHHGGDRLTDKDVTDWEYDIIITSYALAFRDDTIFTNTVWNGLILDEAQQIKNVETKQRKAIKLIKASHRIALTGTPIENKLKELWSIMDMLNDKYLGNFQQFQRAFIREIESTLPNEKKVQQLRLLISPFLLRRKKSDEALELQLPDKTEQTYIVGLTAEQASLYQAVVNELLTSIDEKSSMERRATILSSITKLKQICNHPSQFLKDQGGVLHNRSEKWDLLFTLVEQIIDNGEKLLIFTQYREMGELLQKGLAEQFNIEVPFLHGGLARPEREKLISEFKSNPKKPIFILSLRAGGVGLNLTAANHVIHYDRWWNPAVENQATDRAYRIGQTEKVTVHKLVSKGTIEEKIDRLLIKKQSLSEDVLSVNETSISELSTSELKSLLEWSDPS
ncbi:DEAD/DEAH box helicase [Alkalihalobacterium elongatum]|uniref:DEAD/DEAH box helicase n=1 Tax=Alkalihalobacterium elongatum TaxID=2675466 RepID=UPI001C1F94C9|nr:DEAD/DEAH box helicase [Alkalihalobacterium elongatum]